MNTIGSPPYCEAVWWVRGGSYEKDIAKNNAYNLTNIKRDTPNPPSRLGMMCHSLAQTNQKTLKEIPC
ncbi:MAG: hypothetical protein DRG20_05425 [Deltaproteobacteria bacterium]|nr:MAG: hypothetical protein DRG20_05425 [Deltaproteobacteria bacterium]